MLTFQEFHDQATPVRADTSQFGILYQSNALGGESGELQNLVKKMIRDGSTVEKRRAALIEAGDILFYLRQLLVDLGYTLEDAARAELDKLEAMRKEL